MRPTLYDMFLRGASAARPAERRHYSAHAAAIDGDSRPACRRPLRARRGAAGGGEGGGAPRRLRHRHRTRPLERARGHEAPRVRGVPRTARLAWVTNYGVDGFADKGAGGNTLSVVDLARHEPAGLIDLGDIRRPHFIHVGASGQPVRHDGRAGGLGGRGSRERRSSVSTPSVNPSRTCSPCPPDEKRAFTANTGSGTVSLIPLDDGVAARHDSDRRLAPGLRLEPRPDRASSSPIARGTKCSLSTPSPGPSKDASGCEAIPIGWPDTRTAATCSRAPSTPATWS